MKITNLRLAFLVSTVLYLVFTYSMTSTHAHHDHSMDTIDDPLCGHLGMLWLARAVYWAMVLITLVNTEFTRDISWPAYEHYKLQRARKIGLKECQVMLERELAGAHMAKLSDQEVNALIDSLQYVKSELGK